MPELRVNRTLVKSPPELWTELSEVEGLANHLGEFGQIKITKVEPEKTVAWEGELGSGTVAIEASGWGTKVTLTAAVAEPDPVSDPGEPERVEEQPAATEPTRSESGRPEPDVPSASPVTAPRLAEPAPSGPVEPRPAPSGWQPAPRSAPPTTKRRGFLSRLLGRLRPASNPPRQRAWQPPQASPAWQQPRPPRPQPEPHTGPEPAGRHGPEPASAQVREPAPAPPAKPDPTPEPVRPAAPPDPERPKPPAGSKDAGSGPEPALDADRALAVLEGALDNLGSAHHRPFSRG